MIFSGTNFGDYVNNLNVNPVIVIKISSFYFCTGNFSGITSSYQKWLSEVKYQGTKIKLSNLTSDLPTLDFTVIDYDNNISDTIGAYNFLNAIVYLYYGFQETAITDFIQLGKFTCTNIEFIADSKSYSITCQWWGTALRTPLFRKFTNSTLTAAIMASETELVSDGDLSDGTDWVVADDFSYNLGNQQIEFDYNLGYGSITQDSSDFSELPVASMRYVLSYTLASLSGGTLPEEGYLSSLTTAAFSIPCTAGTHEVIIQIRSDYAFHDLVLEFYSDNLNAHFSIDDISLKYTAVEVTDASDFTTPESAPWGSENDVYAKINAEVFHLLSVSTNKFYTWRARLDTVIQEHAINDFVREIFVIAYDPYKFIMQLLQTNYGGTYNCNVDAWGLDAGNLIDEIACKNDYQRWYHPEVSTSMFHWYLEESPTDAIRYLFNEVLPLIPAFIFVNSDGLLTLHALDMRVPNEGDFDIDENNSNNQRLNIDITGCFSNIEFFSDFNPGTNDFLEKENANEPNISLNIGDINKRTIDVHDINQIADDLKKMIAKRLFGINGYPLCYWSGEVFLSSIVVETGDVVNISNAYLPLFPAKTRGWIKRGGTVIGHSLEFNQNGFKRTIEAAVLNMFAPSQTSNVFVYADITDTTLTVGTAATDATGLVDSHRDYGIFTIEADLPAGASAEESVNMNFTMTDVLGGITVTRNCNLYYDARKSNRKRWEVRVETDEALFTPSNITVTWISETGAAGEKLTYVELIKYKLVAYSLDNVVLTDL